MIAEPQQLADQVCEAIRASAVMHKVSKREVWKPNRKKPEQIRARDWAIKHLLWQGVPKPMIARAFEVCDEVVRKIDKNTQDQPLQSAASQVQEP